MASFFLSSYFPISNHGILEVERSSSSYTDKEMEVSSKPSHSEYVCGWSGTRDHCVSVRPVIFPLSHRGQALGHFSEPPPQGPIPPEPIDGENWGSHAVGNSNQNHWKHLEFQISYTLKLRDLGPTQSIFNLIKLCFAFFGVKNTAGSPLWACPEAHPSSMDTSCYCYPCLFPELLYASQVCSGSFLRPKKHFF